MRPFKSQTWTRNGQLKGGIGEGKRPWRSVPIQERLSAEPSESPRFSPKRTGCLRGTGRRMLLTPVLGSARAVRRHNPGGCYLGGAGSGGQGKGRDPPRGRPPGGCPPWRGNGQASRASPRAWGNQPSLLGGRRTVSSVGLTTSLLLSCWRSIPSPSPLPPLHSAQAPRLPPQSPG